MLTMPFSVAGLELPPAYDLIWSVVPLLIALPLLVLFACAIVSIANHRDQLSGVELLGWLAFVTFAQVIGPILWFAIGRPHATRHLPSGRTSVPSR